MNWLGMFVKRPVAGRTKTRLGRSIGMERAARISDLFQRELANRFATLGDRRVLCHTPDDDATHRYLDSLGASAWERWAQPSGDLGERLQGFFRYAFAARARSAVVIGSDSPDLPSRFVIEAFDHLTRHDAVIGPSADGGYYLIGLRSPGMSARESPPIFTDIPWSESTVLLETVNRLQTAGASVGMLPLWSDVDTIDELDRLRGHLRLRRLSGDAESNDLAERLASEDDDRRSPNEC